MTSTVFANECQSNKDCAPAETCEITSYEHCTTDATGIDVCVTEIESRCVTVPIFCDDDYTCDAPHLTCMESKGPYSRFPQRPDENEMEEWVVPCDGEPDVLLYTLLFGN